MANLGSLWYDLHIHDLTAEDLQAIEKKLKNLGIELDTKKFTESLKKSVESYKGKDLTLGVKTQFLHDAIRSALKQQEFPIKVTVNKAEAQEAVREALLRAGLQRSFNADDKRFYDAETRRMAAMQVATAKAGAQNALAQQRLARAHRNADAAARSHTSASINLGSAMRGNIRIAGELGPMLASAYSIVALKNFMTKVVEIGGELEQQKLANKAILGDEGLANTITSQINSLAIKSPFGVMELNQYAKQLTAFQIPYNELYDTMKRLADISAATSVDMGRIILAYGQIKAATVLKGTEARQLTEANIPIFEMLSNYYTKLEGQIVTVGEVMDRMSKKQIPFQDVKNVLWELTDAGGKFYNMQEVLSESVKAKWKNLADALDLMFADIAESYSKTLMGTAELLTELTTRWKTIGLAVIGAAATYGLYRVAVLANNRVIAANTIALRFNSIAVGANITKWQILKAKVAESISSIGASIRRFATSMRGAFVGFGVVLEAVIMLWQRHSEQMQKAEEIGKQVFTKAAEGAKNLSETVKGIQPPKGLTDLELTQGIEQMETAIKNYSATPIDDINDSLVAQDGHLLTLAERYEVLKEKVDAILASYQKISETNQGSNYDRLITPSINVANAWWRDGLLKNAKDYSNEVTKADNFVNKKLQSDREKIQKFINWAKSVSPEFQKAVKDLSLDAAYKELVLNRDRYEDIYSNKKGTYYIHNFTKSIKNGKDKFEKDLTEFIRELRQRIRTEWDANPDELSDEQKNALVIALNTMIDEAEGVSGEVKDRWRRLLEDEFNISFDASVDVTPLLNKELSVNFKNYLGKEIADKIKSGLKISPNDKEFELVKEAVKDAMVAIYAGVDNATKQALDEAVSDENINKTTGLVLHSLYSKNAKPKALGNTSQKDTLAESLKQRLDTLKKAYSEYKKELAVMNKDAALERIKSAGIFDELFSGENAITNFDSYKSTLAKLLEEAEAALKGVSENDSRFKGRHDLVISLRTLLNLEIPRDETKDALDKAKREIDSLVSETTKKWDLFKQLYETTGDRQWSMDAAFSDNLYFDEAATELVKTLNERIEDKGLTINVPFEITEDKAKELFGNENEDLFNLWKTIRERASKDGVDAWKAEAKAMQEYIREYGTFQQRRLAIEKDYAAKIADARAKGNVTEARLLGNQRDTAKQNLEVEAIKQSIDWGSVFSSFGTMFKEQLGPTIENLRAITKTADFKNSGVQNQQTLYELINKLEEANTSWDSDIFATLGKDLEAYQTAMLDYIDAQDKERIATDELTAAKERLAKAEASGDSTAIAAAARSVTVATDKLNTASEKVRSFGANVQDATSNLKTSATTANNMFNTLASSLAGFKSGSLQGVGDSLMNLDKLFNNSGVTNAVGSALSKGLSKLLGNSEIANSVGAALGNSGLIGPIISAILSILDTLKDGIGVLVSDLLDTILGAVAGILKSLFNGKMFVQIGNAIKDGIAGILDAITLGGFSSWFDTSNAKKVKETIDRLTERNESLQTAIEDLRDTIKKYSSTKAIIDTNEAIQLQKEREKNFLDIAKTQAGYHGNHHSWDYYWNGFSEEQIAKFSKQIGRAWDGNIWGLSPEEMKLLRSNVEMWESIRNSGKGGYGGDLVDKLDDYIEQAGVIEELTAELYQTLTGMSFDTMYDGFLDTLMKMDSTAADFADNISEYFFKAMLSKKIGDLFGKQLEDWYNKFGEAVASDTISDAEVRNKLTDEYMGIIDEALKWRDQFAQATGYTGESTSKSGMSAGIQGVTESTADLLASYINGIRGDVSLQTNVHWPRLLDEVFPQMNVIAESQLRAQNQIAENTLRNALAAEAIVKSNDEISKLLNRVAMGGAKFYVN